MSLRGGLATEMGWSLRLRARSRRGELPGISHEVNLLASDNESPWQLYSFIMASYIPTLIMLVKERG